MFHRVYGQIVSLFVSVQLLHKTNLIVLHTKIELSFYIQLTRVSIQIVVL